jgi:hypothetical protein
LTAGFSTLNPTLSQYSGNLGAGLHAEQPQAQVKHDFFATESIVLDNSFSKTKKISEVSQRWHIPKAIDKFASALWYFVKPCDVAWF